MRKKNPEKKIVVKQLLDDEISTILKKIGKLIKEKRKPIGSLEDFSYEIRISRSAVARYESGGDMELSNFLKVVCGLGIEPEDFFKLLKKNKSEAE